MKKIILCILTLGVLTLTSCSSDDDGSINIENASISIDNTLMDFDVAVQNIQSFRVMSFSNSSDDSKYFIITLERDEVGNEAVASVSYLTVDGTYRYDKYTVDNPATISSDIEINTSNTFKGTLSGVLSKYIEGVGYETITVESGNFDVTF
ncbi:hypothetical protein [Gaetbulibacter sp. PBL-D1]|uniref:hypothetical protein n=1 Tax=Gaetbulibacter sp. PBL-D1 TaxID=3422594 RepID=UPI003D2F460B